MMAKRVFLIVLDSCGCGEMPDSAEFGDAGSNTLRACTASSRLDIPTLSKMGIFNIDSVDCGTPVPAPTAAYGRMAEKSRGKDTTIGHWELAGLISPHPLPTFPDGFPADFVQAFEEKTGRKVLCNKPYSGTEVIRDYGREQKETGGLICYTSADSVFQIAANEADIPPEELYRICEIAREMLTGPELGVGRVIARPYTGEYPNYVRTSNRHDFSLLPPAPTLLDELKRAGLATIGVGKIYDIFAGQGITDMVRNKSNADGMEHTLHYATQDFEGLCFVNLVDFDMLYGHRNDVDGYAAALTEFDGQLRKLLPMLKEDDLLFITADHGCDPSTPSTDHSREHVPLLAYGAKIKAGYNLGTRSTYADLAATVAEYFGVKANIAGTSFLREILK